MALNHLRTKLDLGPITMLHSGSHPYFIKKEYQQVQIITMFMCLMSFVLYPTFIRHASDKMYSPTPASCEHQDDKVKFRPGANGCNFQWSPSSLTVLELNLACDLSPARQKDWILSPKPLIRHQRLFHALQSDCWAIYLALGLFLLLYVPRLRIKW